MIHFFVSQNCTRNLAESRSLLHRYMALAYEHEQPVTKFVDSRDRNAPQTRDLVLWIN